MSKALFEVARSKQNTKYTIIIIEESFGSRKLCFQSNIIF